LQILIHKMMPHRSGIVWLAADERPSFDATPVARLPVRVFGFKREAGLNHEVHDSSILEANRNGVVFTGGEEFNVVQWFAVRFFKAMEVAAVITAIVVLPRLVIIGLGKVGIRRGLLVLRAGCVRWEERLL
jgi:hypothetical protein